MFKEKILCIGTNSQDTDKQVSVLALKNKTKNHGLINSVDIEPSQFGFYHTSVIDIASGDIIKIAHKFDSFVLLDQAINLWSSQKILFTSFNLMLDLEQLGYAVDFRKNSNTVEYLLHRELVKNNKSFCIYPWIELIEENGKVTLCPRSSKKVTSITELQDWRTDKNFTEIRQKMLSGERLPHCGVCYEYEEKNIESYRQFDTKDWLSKLKIKDIAELDNIEKPLLYEVRLNNKCNLMCRSCNPGFSHLIAREARLNDLKFFSTAQYKYCSLDIIDIDSLGPNSTVYLTGGEPTVIADVYRFMQQCINQDRTNFQLTFSTNGMKFSDQFVELSRRFSKLNLSFSIDGYGLVNDYWRWKSKWEQVISNAKKMLNLGHNININCVPGIYNVTNLHLLYEFLEREFPLTSVYLQINYEKNQSALNHPNSELVVKSMQRCKQTSIYYSNGKSNKTMIDSLYDHYSSDPKCDLVALKDFFVYNDKLDEIRNVKLKDYIPELEECRKFLGD